MVHDWQVVPAIIHEVMDWYNGTVVLRSRPSHMYTGFDVVCHNCPEEKRMILAPSPVSECSEGIWPSARQIWQCEINMPCSGIISLCPFSKNINMLHELEISIDNVWLICRLRGSSGQQVNRGQWCLPPIKPKGLFSYRHYWSQSIVNTSNLYMSRHQHQCLPASNQAQRMRRVKTDFSLGRSTGNCTRISWFFHQ